MIDKIKKSWAGQHLYKASRTPIFGYPLRLVARGLQSERIHPDHFLTKNRARNARQEKVLEAFESRAKP